jgi:hypothetical protein
MMRRALCGWLLIVAGTIVNFMLFYQQDPEDGAVDRSTGRPSTVHHEQREELS